MHGELKYWLAKKGKASGRSARMHNFLEHATVCADIGCGPRGGVFDIAKYPKMYGVDPLWPDYERLGLDTANKEIKRITATAATFALPEKADFIVSFNAMDHGGNLRDGVENVMRNLSPDGLFIMHMHLRTKKQLGKLHNIFYTVEDVRKCFDSFSLKDRLFEKDPIMGATTKKRYKTFVGWARVK